MWPSVSAFNTTPSVDPELCCLPMLLSISLIRVRGKWWMFFRSWWEAHGLLKRNRRNTQFILRDNMKICEKCQGSMVVERAVDLEVGLSILYFACLNCYAKTESIINQWWNEGGRSGVPRGPVRPTIVGISTKGLFRNFLSDGEQTKWGFSGI